MIRRISLAVVITILAVGTLSAKNQGPKHMGKSTGPEMHPPAERNILVKVAGLEPIAEKYRIQIQRVMLTSKEANLELHDKKRQIMIEIKGLCHEYDKDPGKAGPQIAQRLEMLQQIETRIAENRKSAMDQIDKLHEQKRKELERGVDKWVKTVSSNPGEMKKFVEHVKKIQSPK